MIQHAQREIYEVEDTDSYPEIEDLKTGVLYDATQDQPRHIRGDLRTLPGKFFGSTELFQDGFLGRSFCGPTTPDRVGQYVYGERKRLEALRHL